MKYKLIYLLFYLSLIGCSDYENPESGQVVNEIYLKEGEIFDVKIEGLSQPNQFQARIYFSSTQNQNFEIRKTSSSPEVTRYPAKANQRNEFLDDQIKAGSTYKYSVGVVIDGIFKELKSIDLEVQPDVVIDGVLNLDSFKQLRSEKIFRIYFKANSVLKTRGEDVALDIDQIFSEGGRIQTFSEGDEAPIGVPGAHSGKIYLKVSKIEGPFVLEVRGQRGGQGLKGPTGAQGAKGAKSKEPFVDQSYIMSTRSGVCNRYWYNLAKDQSCGNLSYEECRLQFHFGVGGPGGPGYSGYPGGVGAVGGNAEISEIEIPDLSENQKVIFEPGLGGRAGEGGEGGPGGQGGDGAPFRDNPGNSPCDPSPLGRVGAIGPKGPMGSGGAPGIQETLLVNGTKWGGVK